MTSGASLSENGSIPGFRIIRVLGAGSFGITYLAYDENLQCNVAIKEYFPAAYARRLPDGRVEPLNDEASRIYAWGLERFADEARTLRKFRHPNIVSVHQILPNIHNTAYIVMEFLEGVTLEDRYNNRAGLPDATTYWSILSQLLDGLEAVHKLGILHRDIKPSNIMLHERTPVLIDFGSARDLALQGTGFSAIVTDGYSPQEQYSKTIPQGPWTDIYALAGTGRYLLNGKTPPIAAARGAGEALEPIDARRRAEFWPSLPAGIDRGIALSVPQRPQSVTAWRTMLGSPPAIGQPKPDRRLLLLGGAGALVAAGGSIAAWLMMNGEPLSDGAQPLTVAWSRDIGPMGPDPWAQIVGIDKGAILAAKQFGSDGVDRMFALRVGDDGAESGRWLGEGFGRAASIAPTSDGGALIGGRVGDDAVVVRLGPDWRPQWQRSYGAGNITSIAPIKGGAIVAGFEGINASGSKILGLDPDGTVRRQKVVEINAGDTTQRVIARRDGGFAVLGLRNSDEARAASGGTGMSMWIALLDKDLNETIRPNLTGLGAARGWDIAEVGDALFVTGSTDSGATNAEQKLLMASIDEHGTWRWQKWNYADTRASGRSLARAGSRLYVAGGVGEPRRMRLGQIGPEGELLWQTVLPPGAGDNATIIASALRPGGNGFAVGASWSQGNSIFHLSLLRLMSA